VAPPGSTIIGTGITDRTDPRNASKIDISFTLSCATSRRTRVAGRKDPACSAPHARQRLPVPYGACLPLLETLFMQGIPAVLTEHEGILVDGMHTLVTDRTVIVRTWLASVRVCGGARRCRGGSAGFTRVSFADTWVGDGVRGYRSFSKYLLQLTG